MRNFFTRIIPVAVLLFFSIIHPLSAQAPALASEQTEYVKAKVIEVVETGSQKVEDIESPWQRVNVELLTGRDQGKTVSLTYGQDTILSKDVLLKKGEKVILTNVAAVDNTTPAEYVVVTKYRATGVWWAFAIFFIFTIIFSGKKGVGAIIGLAFSIFVLIWFMVPAIMKGYNPVLISLAGSLVIVVVSLVLSHGFSKRTMVSLASIVTTLAVGTFMAQLFVVISKVYGRGSEDALFLTQVGSQMINLRGLLLAGIIVGMLGVLDDVATTQTAAIYELKAADNRFRFADLFTRGLKIGKEHIASLVNTLALAYVGASFPLLLLFATAESPSVMLALNSESLVEEIIRTLVGSTALVMAVPITTLFAAYVYGKMDRVEHDASLPEHHHH